MQKSTRATAQCFRYRVGTLPRVSGGVECASSMRIGIAKTGRGLNVRVRLERLRVAMTRAVRDYWTHSDSRSAGIPLAL